jgi:hypothetical protein
LDGVFWKCLLVYYFRSWSLTGSRIKSATSALTQQTDLILRLASNKAEAPLREFLLRLKEETLALST